MASVKGVNITNLDAVPAVAAPVDQTGGRLRVWYDTYEASSLAAGSDITIARVPEGANIFDVVIHHDALGTSVTLKVGDSSDDNRYITATAAATAGNISMSDDGAITGFGFENTSETNIVITTAGAAATGTIMCAIFYTVD
jgi:hypothetical protein